MLFCLSSNGMATKVIVIVDGIKDTKLKAEERERPTK